MAKKAYVVWVGFSKGVYDTWGECQLQVNGFSGAIFRGFNSRKEAEREFKLGNPDHRGRKVKQKVLDKINPNFGNGRPDPRGHLMGGGTVIYTDGSCLPGMGGTVGGFGALILNGKDKRMISGGLRNTTAQRMEVLACIEGLKVLKKRTKVVVHTDSQYLIRQMNGGKRKVNGDLFFKLDGLVDRHDVSFRWVKGHSGVKGNEIADKLAGTFARQTIEHNDFNCPEDSWAGKINIQERKSSCEMG